MRIIATVVLAVATVAAPSWASAQTAASSRALEISFQDGLVTLVARGVTVPEIMAEWARKGGSRITNAEKIVGGPVSYEFKNVPETVALQSVLRSASGYIAAPRRPGGPTGPSTIEQVMIVATSRPSANAVITMPTAPAQNPQVYQGSPDDDIPPVTVNPQPQPQQPRPQAPSTQPNIGVGTSPTPGVVVAPTKPGTPVPPGTIIKSPLE
ncbi:MAG: hypothetical protein KAY59_07725 [Acidobacteria bacterium]|nr:hypothetical protein [Acidobacteriota bacterium]